MEMVAVSLAQNARLMTCANLIKKHHFKNPLYLRERARERELNKIARRRYILILLSTRGERELEVSRSALFYFKTLSLTLSQRREEL